RHHDWMLRTAIVVATHPERRQVDLCFTDNGWQYAGAQVCGHVSSDGGDWHVPSVPKPSTEQSASSLNTSGRNLVAVCGFVGSKPIVLSFIQPEGGQLQFTQQDRAVARHSSGAYTTTAPDGSMEWFHPSGAFVRMGTGVAHEDLTPLSADKNWSIPAGAAVPSFAINTGKAVVTIDPSGNVVVNTSGTLTATYGSMTLNGNVQLNGTLTATGDIKAGTISLEAHKHSGVTTGSGTTAVPQ
ncbi:MAG: hypothetical protein ACRYHQ_40510, partial [Janthinobacterium lividum]